MSDRITVLIVDDSALVRRALRSIFDSDSRFLVVGDAANGMEAVEKAQVHQPRLITMDLDMPEMDGLQAIAEIMAKSPTRILVVTGVPRFGGHDSTFEALSRGALELLPKPSAFPATDRECEQLLHTAAMLSAVPVIPHVRALRADRKARRTTQPVKSAESDVGVIAIGASTGGPGIIRSLLHEMPKTLGVPLVIVQHLSNMFASNFLEWLSESTELKVKEALPGTRLEPGTAFVAIRGSHVVVSQSGWIDASHEPPRDGNCPAIDVLFESVARVYGQRSIGVLLTGMGRDGAAGLKAIATANGRTIVQNEASSVVFGMPKAAIDLGAAQRVLDANEIARALNSATAHIDPAGENK